jgi:hypothetical protein
MPTNRLPTPGSDSGNWGTILNSYLNTTLSDKGGINTCDVVYLDDAEITTSNTVIASITNIYTTKPVDYILNKKTKSLFKLTKSGSSFTLTKVNNIPHTFSVVNINTNSIFRWIEDTTTPANSDWQLVFSSEVNIKDWGARGDGVTDDTIPIKTLIQVMFLFYKIEGVMNLLGGEIYFPSGKYLITDTISLPPGTTLRGAVGGLLSKEPIPSTGSNLILSTTKSDGTPWTDSAMFKIVNGGPVAMFNLSFLGTQTVTNSVWLDSYNITDNYPGLTQGKFENCRIMAFTTAVKSTKMADVVFINTGFEYNLIIFHLSGKDGNSPSLGGSYFSNCTFFGYYRAFSLSTYGKCYKNNFSNCIFESSDTGQVGVTAITNEASSNTLFSGNNFSSCIFITANGTAINYFGGTNDENGARTNVFSNNVFVSTSFIDSSIIFQDNKSSVENNIVNACVFNNSDVNMQYNTDSLTFNNNTLIGNSNLNFSSVKNSQICNNNFAKTTNDTYDINLNDICRNNIIVGNTIKKVITIHPASTNNLNINNLTVV